MKIRLGVLGAYRGFAITDGCRNDDDFEVYAVCDKNRERLDVRLKRSQRRQRYSRMRQTHILSSNKNTNASLSIPKI